MVTSVSIIVPVQDNAGELRTLLQSVAEQDLQGIEVIIVDTSPTGECPAIPDLFASFEMNIVLLRHPQAGIQEARLYGITAANSDVIIFASPGDSFCGSSILRRHVQKFNDSGVDILLYRHVINNEDGMSVEIDADEAFSFTRETMGEHEIFRSHIDRLEDIFLWGKIYRQTIWLRLESYIQKNRISDDYESMFMLLLYIFHVRTSIKSALLGYRHHTEEEPVCRPMEKMAALTTLKYGVGDYLRNNECPDDLVRLLTKRIDEVLVVFASFIAAYVNTKDDRESLISSLFERDSSKELIHYLLVANARMAMSLKMIGQDNRPLKFGKHILEHITGKDCEIDCQ